MAAEGRDMERVESGRRNLRGCRFGKLVCMEPTRRRSANGCVLWSCRCDCGQTCLAATSQLMYGYKKSCGCLKHPELKDFVGRRFGRLVVTEYAGKRSGMHRWRCRCDCGAETIVGQTLLQSGKTQSCGCLRACIIMENLKQCEGTSVKLLELTKKRRIASNTSGYTGVYRKKGSEKWFAQITFQRRTYYLGGYERLEDAIKARQTGERMHDDFLNWYYGRRPDAEVKD